jgi:hypothetical protein
VIHKSADESTGVDFLLWCREQIKDLFRAERDWIAGQHHGTEVQRSSITTGATEGGELVVTQKTNVDFLVDEEW